MKKTFILLIFITSFLGLNLHGAEQSAKELLILIEQQQAQINALREMVEKNQAVAVETQSQVEATALAIESSSGSGQNGWWDKTSLGGYGELHANLKEGGDDKVDFHRFVLFVNHDYNDWISLFTELELEHSLAGEGKPGEVELEQAFIRMDWNKNFSTDVGLYLTPVGLLNETHEPDTFYGVERNSMEKYIIPTTWWEAGIKATYRFENGLSIDAGISSGLDSNDGYIRGGRQKVANANFTEQAFTGRVNYSGIPGLNIGASVFYQGDINQSDVVTTTTTYTNNPSTNEVTPTTTSTTVADGETSALLKVIHLDYKKNGFGLRAVYADWDLSGDVVAAAEDQNGYYIEPSYRWTASEKYGDLGIFYRKAKFDYFKSGSLKRNKVDTIGINYWPTENVVLKADYESIQNSNNKINLGFGYQF